MPPCHVIRFLSHQFSSSQENPLHKSREKWEKKYSSKTIGCCFNTDVISTQMLIPVTGFLLFYVLDHHIKDGKQ